MKEPLTIKDIARLANVSQGTVSKALNDRPDIGAKTKKMILKIAEENGYSPNAFGKALRSQNSNTIGVIFRKEDSPLRNSFFSRILEGIEGELAFNRLNLVLYLMPDAQADQLPEMVREKRVDGVILVGSDSQDFLRKLQSYQIPTILIEPRRAMTDCPKLLIDNKAGAFVATEHLIEHGHRKIAFISGELSRPSFSERLQGYKNALTHYKLGIKTQYIRHHGFEAGYALTKSLLAESDPPTAIFCANDINAIYAYKAINEAGLQVGEDISLVGFDDIDLGRLATPALTTIRVYKEELGSVAVRQLKDIIYENSELHYTTIIPVKLIERDSVKTITQNH